MTSRARLRRLPAVAGTVLVLLLAGCGSDGDDPGSGGSGSPSPTSSSSASVPVPSPTPTVEPADGPRIRTEGATIRAPKGYRLVSDFGVLQGYRDDQGNVSFLPGYTDKPSLDAFARQAIRTAKNPGALERVDDVVVGGEYNAFHLLDTSDPVEERHIFGTMFLNGSWIITMGFYNEEVGDLPPLTAEERQEVMDSVLATFEPTVS